MFGVAEAGWLLASQTREGHSPQHLQQDSSGPCPEPAGPPAPTARVRGTGVAEVVRPVPHLGTLDLACGCTGVFCDAGRVLSPLGTLAVSDWCCPHEASRKTDAGPGSNFVPLAPSSGQSVPVSRNSHHGHVRRQRLD